MQMLAYWDPKNVLLATLFIVAFPTIPLALYFGLVLRRRRPSEVGGADDIRRGASTNTPVSLIGWIGVLFTSLVFLGVAIALVAQRATGSHPGNPTQRGPSTIVNTGPDPTLPNQGNAAAGGRVFASSGCGNCHTLKAARARGKVGPNLDQSRPDFARVVECVTTGPGDMPTFTDKLTPTDIRNVAAFVVSVGTGNSDDQGGDGP